MISNLQTYIATPAKTDAKVTRPAPTVQVVGGGDHVDGAGDVGSSAGRTDAAHKKASEAEVEHALKEVSNRLQTNQRTLQFSVDKDTNSTVVKVIDSETHKLIRQIPSEELLSISKRLDAATGMLFNEKA